MKRSDNSCNCGNKLLVKMKINNLNNATTKGHFMTVMDSHTASSFLNIFLNVQHKICNSSKFAFSPPFKWRKEQCFILYLKVAGKVNFCPIACVFLLNNITFL